MTGNVLVTGANGQLGQAIRKRSDLYPSFSFFYTDIDTLDITDKDAVQACLNKHRIHSIINTAAYTAVDQAEKEPDKAYLINAEAVKTLACAARDNGSRLIHISTDYVFDGTNHRPYGEA
ncbi:MAG: sugar nucleotide-binding protein, partial [Tannerellaceae bacterium]|nr:sugar nucleotide-binding protein [Tannerellaceae bacterium]